MAGADATRKGMTIMTNDKSITSDRDEPDATHARRPPNMMRRRYRRLRSYKVRPRRKCAIPSAA